MAEMERYWALSDSQRNNQLGFFQHFNIAPTLQIPIIYPGNEGLEMTLAAGDWCVSGGSSWRCHPSRSTRELKKRIVKTSRCLIPAIGWYEWKEVEVTDPLTGEIKKATQPKFIRLPGRQVFPFADLNVAMESCRAWCCNTDRRHFHPSRGRAGRWRAYPDAPDPTERGGSRLNRSAANRRAALDAAQAVTVIAVVHHAVSSRVNNSKSAGAELIEPFEIPAWHRWME
jgi:putative SOS response-associated peptidase YedK